MQTVDDNAVVTAPEGTAAPLKGSARRLFAAQRGWLAPLVLFLIVFGVYAATAARHTVNTDARAASIGAWRIASTGKPWLDGVDPKQLGGVGRPMRGSWLSRAPNGHVVVQRMAGPIIVGIPFYALLDRGADPHSFSVSAGGIAAAFVTALAVLFMFLALRRHLPESLALTGALIFALATPTWSVSANGLWTHPVTQLGIAGAAYALSRDRWWLAGVFLGIGMFGRPHVALVAAAVGLGIAWSRRNPKIVVGLAVPTILALGLLEAWNRFMFGAWSIGGAYSGNHTIGTAVAGQSSQWLNYAGFFASADRSILIWSPAFLVLISAVVRSWRSLPDWVRWLPLGGVLYTIVQLRLDNFTGGTGYFGYRLGLELLTCLMPMLALSMPRMGGVARWVFPALVGAQLAAFSLGSIFEAFFVQSSHVWTDNGYWLALRTQPVLVGGWLAYFVLVGCGVSYALARRRRRAEVPADCAVPAPS